MVLPMNAPLLLLLLLIGLPANAVLIDSGDGTGNTSAPSPDPGWDHVGILWGNTAVYIGDGCVLTPSHVSAGPVDFGGTVYPEVPGSAVRMSNGDGTNADLVVFAVDPAPPLPVLPISGSPPPLGAPVVLVGHGRNRGAAILWDPPWDGPEIGGYEWAPGKTLRWGKNRVDEFPQSKVLNTWAFNTLFDQNVRRPEAQAALGDSGGAVFRRKGATWELDGLLFALTTYPGQPAETSLYGQPSHAADLSFYRDQILGVECLPEPSGGLPAGLLALGALARRRHRP